MPRNKRSSARMSPFPPDDRRFKDTFFLVEASHFEKHILWKEWHGRVKWDQDTFGYMPQVGTLDNRPVMLSFWWARIEGKLVAFWKCESQVADHDLIEKWFNKHFPAMLDSERRARTDANNFHICIHAIQEANEAELSAATA